MFDRRLVEHFDWGLVGITLLLGVLGLVILYSAEATGAALTQKVFCGKQILWFCIGLTVMVCSFMINYKSLDRWGPFIYTFSIVLLVCVLLFGKYGGGSKRWLVLGPLTIQPSELVKLTVIISLAQYYSKRATQRGFNLHELVGPITLVLVPFVMIYLQPDLGTALLIVLIAASMTVFVKIEFKSFLCIIGAGMGLVMVFWMFLLNGYQRQRVLTFLNPDREPFGAGYHIIQSKIAIGSGMIFGKGFLKGTQNALSFLPEQHTDFIMSVLSEEWGFVGAGFILFIYLILILWGINIAHGCRDPFGTIISVGISAMLFWQVFINAGMVMGLMPVVGVPLPLISYGGSSVVTILIGIGLLLNIRMRRFIIE